MEFKEDHNGRTPPRIFFCNSGKPGGVSHRIGTYILGITLFFIIVSGPAAAETGLGMSSAFSYGTVFFYGDVYGEALDPAPLFIGPAFKLKQTPLFFEMSAEYWPSGGMFHSNMNAGLCADIAFVELGFSLGLDAVIVPNAGDGSITSFGNNLALYMALRISHYSMGVHAAVPLDLLKNMKEYGETFVWPFDELRIFAAMIYLDFLYWF